MVFSSDFSSDFDEGKPRLGDTIAIVVYMPGNQSTCKFIGLIKEFVGPEHSEATHIITDIPSFEALQIEICSIKINPVYKWVAEFALTSKR